MNSFHHLTQSLIITGLSTVVALSAQAQEGNGDTRPVAISRMCLWNADNTMWKTLGLTRSQIARMDELRRLYPAVVDGQWVAVDDDVEPVPVGNDQRVGSNISTSIAGSAVGMVATEKEEAGSTTATKARAAGLQSHLREVLTPAQLRHWAQRCPH